MSDLNQNLNQLQKLYRIITPQDLLGNYKIEKFSNSPANTNLGWLGRILSIFVDTVDSSGESGLLSYDEIKTQLKNLSTSKDFQESNPEKEIKKYINLHENISIDTVLGTEKPKDTKTELRVISLKSPNLGISLRDVNRIGTFLNAIPSFELSRCVPRLEVNFELAFPGENSDDPKFAAQQNARSTTLLRYLNGASTYGSADTLMAVGAQRKDDQSSRASNQKDRDKWKNSTIVTSGMELFTSPQTLTSPDNTLGSANRIVPVLDRFASFMSIESLEITGVPAGGSFMNKTATLNINLHDRSRLHEIAAYIKPDAYSRSTISMTYGWSHPDTSGNSPIADLINQMVVKDERYNIINSSFSFGNGGGVKIALKLSIKGSGDINVLRISSNPEYSDSINKLEELSEQIKKAREKIPALRKPDSTSKEIRVYQIIDSAANNGELIDNVTVKQQEAELQKFIDNLKKRNNASDVGPELQEFLKSMVDYLRGKEKLDSPFDPKVKNEKKIPLVDTLLGDKFKAILGQDKNGKPIDAPDPFFNIKDENDPTSEGDAYWQEKDLLDLQKLQKGKPDKIAAKPYVSLAKLMLFYVGVPLQTLGYEEVQFIYYPINTEAGKAGGTCLSGFPVELAYFRDVLAEQAKRTKNANMTVKQFVQLLNDSVLSDVRNWVYGMRSLYNERKQGKPSEPPELKKNQEDKIDGRFRKPIIEIQIESRGTRISDKSDKKILRFHIYDKLSSAYEPAIKVLEAQNKISRFGQLDDYTSTFRESTLRDISKAIGIDYKEGTNAQFTSYEDMKKVVSQMTPVLKYGSNHSGIIAGTLQTMQNSELATVNMQRAMGPQYNSEPNGSSVSSLPLRVQPSQLDLTLIGCPLLNGTQQYFIDFDTGTTVDDLYVLTHYSHRIAAGKFESTSKFTPMNAYGSYENILSRVRNLHKEVQDFNKKTKT